jgi:hypothetical protein
MRDRSERQIRLAQNEAVFRAVNERIKALNEAFAVITETFDVVCECADPGCIKQVRVSMDAYERIRTDATLFIVARGHEVPELEDTIEKPNDYSCVSTPACRSESPRKQTRDDRTGLLTSSDGLTLRREQQALAACVR